MNSLRGAVALLIMAVNTVVACLPLYLLGLVRFFCRSRGRGTARAAISRAMDRMIDLWVGMNRLVFRALDITRIEVRWEGDVPLDRHGWYVVVSNHQSWADILVLQNCLWGRIPPLKFFTKRQLIWVPLIGPAMWLLGFPYVRRLGKAQLAARPELANLDRQSTLDACGRFRDHPTAMLNFLEGTRFTEAKHSAQQARFDHLLNPKITGMSYVVTGLKDRLHKLLDVTIIYPGGIPSFWDLLQGRCRRVEVVVQERDLPPEVRAGADNDTVRARLDPWIEALWNEKDARLESRQVLAN